MAENQDLFAQLLSKPVNEIEPPKPMPAGHWVFMGTTYKTGESSQNKTPLIEFTCKPLRPLDDVDEDEVKEFGDFSNVEMRVTQYVTEKALHNLAKFMIDCGVATPEDDTPLNEVIPGYVNCQFVGLVVKQASTKDPERMVSFIDKTMSLGDN